jgi:ribosomal protein L40E
MLTWDDLRARAAPCRRCGFAFRLAGPLSPSVRARVKTALHAGAPIDVWRLLREETGAGLADAKGTYQHLVRRSGVCHGCGAALPPSDLADCAACQALNVLL